jgi:tetratricopeptide (TPR) repeat protein
VLVLVLGGLQVQAAAPPAMPRHLTAQEQKELRVLQVRRDQLAAAGEFDQAARLAEQVVLLRERLQGARHWQAIDARLGLAGWQALAKVPKSDRPAIMRARRLEDKALMLGGAGQFSEAERFLRNSLAIYRKVNGDKHPHTLRCSGNLATCLDRQGKRGEAHLLLRDALAICRDMYGEEHPKTADAYINLAGLLDHQGKYPDALSYYRRGIAIRLEVLGEKHPETATGYGLLAGSLFQQGKYREEEPEVQRARDIFLALFGEEHPKTTTAGNNLAMCLNRQGKHRKALRMYRRLLVISSKANGEQHPITSLSCNNLASCLDDLGEHDEAMSLYRRALAIDIKVHGEQHADTATCYNNLAHCMVGQGNYIEALPLLKRSLDILLNILGKRHRTTILAYNNLASCLDQLGKHDEALPLHESALAAFRRLHGEQHPLTALSYMNLAGCLDHQGKYVEALPLYQKALAIYRKAHGEQHPDTARGYHNVAHCLENQGKYAEALPLYRRALAIRLKVFGEQHPQTALSYDCVAGCSSRQGHGSEALPLYRRALAISRKVLGEKHPVTARVHNNLGGCLQSLGRDAEALLLFERALALYEQLLGQYHPTTAGLYMNVAGCLDSQGRHGEALPLYQRALAIFLKVHGEKHIDTARSYHNVAACLVYQGKYGEALPLHQRALAIRLAVLGEQHPDTALSYNYVGNCLKSLGRFSDALLLFRRALAVFLAVHGEQHSATATTYNQIALCLQRQQKSEEALPLYQRALAIRVKVLGEQHPETAQSYSNVGYCLNAQGKYGEAEPLYRHALAIRLTVLGKQHPDTIQGYNNLAYCMDHQGKRAEALHLLQASLPDQEAVRFHTASIGFDRALAFAEKASPHAMLAAGLTRLGQPRNALRHAELALARGLLDDLATSDPAESKRMAELSSELQQLGERLAPLLGLSDLSAEQVKVREQLFLRRRTLESERGKLSAAVSARQVLALERIQERIPADAALVLWVTDLGEHLGCVLRHQGPPVWVPMPRSGKGGDGSAENLDLARRCYAALIDPTAAVSLRESLYRKKLAPLEAHLEGVKHLLVVPTGVLALVPVEALTDRWTISYVPSGSAYARAAELPHKPQPTSALVLADPVFTPTSLTYPPTPPHGLLVKDVMVGSLAARNGLRRGDILLEYAGKTLKTPNDLEPSESGDRVVLKRWRDGKTDVSRISSGTLGVVVDDRPVEEALMAWRSEERKLLAAHRGANWAPLPGTRLEARWLANLLPSPTVLLGSAASEQTLEKIAVTGKLKSIGLLHLATHGEANLTRPLDTALILAQDHLPQPREQEMRVLAGKRPMEGKLSVDTILKQWTLDAELVTLSACQSGLGADARGEGMLGFAQALLTRGARSVLLSRWKVDDSATALLMVRFYENLLGKRGGLKAPLGKAESLREAKQWLRTLSREEAQKRLTQLADGVPRGERGSIGKPLPPRREGTGKDDRPFEHPYYWAAFVLVGDPR